MKDMQTEQLLCWSGMTDTEHTTSGSNEEVPTSYAFHFSQRCDYLIVLFALVYELINLTNKVIQAS